MSDEQEQAKLTDYPYRMSIQTRWSDNDMLGHLNNVVYNRFIEAIVTRFTVLELGVDWLTDDCYPVSVETSCRYIRQLSWPETVEAGLRVGRLGNSSVAYEIGLFGEHEISPAAIGRFVHVFIGRHNQRPESVPDAVRDRLKAYSVATK